MRIISGKYKGRKIQGFDIDGTRPTMDRVKESLFGIIQTYIKDAVVLDLFAGSGSLGIEALSNGSKKAYFIDNNNIAISTIKNNLQNIENGILIKKDYKEFLKNTNEKFDIIFLDPPYQLNYINDCLKLIEERELLNKNGIIICEYENELIEPIYEVIREKKYGTTKIMVIRR